MKQPLLLLTLLPMLAGISACSDCDDLGERKFGVVFIEDGQPTEQAYTQVYGLGGSGPIAIQATDSLYRLPISLHQDSSTFILQPASGPADTLTLRYTRTFHYQDKQCGFRVRFSGFGVGQSTTFEQVQVVDVQYTPGIFFNYPEEIYEVRIYR